MRGSTLVLLLVAWVGVYVVLLLLGGGAVGWAEVVLFWVITVAIVSVYFSLHEKEKHK